VTHRLKLREALAAQTPLMAEMLEGLRKAEAVALLGIEVQGLSILSISASPDMAKALEAEARESLLRQADEAVYARRNAAVGQGRMIKGSELNTEIAGEGQKRETRQAQLSADSAAEEKRQQLLERKVANDRKDSDSRAYALEAMLKPLRGTDWRVLAAVSGGKADARHNISLAFRELAEKAEK